MENVKTLLTESTKGLISEDTINKLVEMNEKYIEAQLMEAAEKFVEKENKLRSEIDTLKENAINWLDEVAQELFDKKNETLTNEEINKDVAKFYKLLKEMNKKYINDEDETEADETECDVEDKQKNKKKMKSKYAETETDKEDDEDEEDETGDVEGDLQEEIEFLKKQNYELIKTGLIAEKITHNSKLSEKQKDDLSFICEGAEFDGNIDKFITFINQNVELVLAGNDSISKSGMSDDPTIVKESVEEIIIDQEAEETGIKKVKKVFKQPFNKMTNVDVKSYSAKLV